MITPKGSLVGIITGKESESRINEYLDELEFLVETAGGQTIARFTQKLENLSHLLLLVQANYKR